MCVICVQPAGKYLDRDTAKAMWDKNPDGGGFAYITPDNTIYTEKAMTFHKFWGAFEHHRSQNRDKDFLVHMRIATHGGVTMDNVHPFKVDEHTVMAHNGIIHEVEDDPTNEMSDTRIFIRDVLPELSETWLDSKYLGSMVAEWVGWSKLAFLTVNPKLKGTVYVINEKKGAWDKGMWFSNMNHRKVVYGTSKFGASYDGKTSYGLATNYKGGTQNDQTWDKNKQEWVDGPATSEEKVRYPDSYTYDSLKDYWDDKPTTSGQELFLDKGGKTWLEGDLPWSNTITQEERALQEPMFEGLLKTRNEIGFDKPFAYDDEYKYWWCYGCDEEIDTQTGICDCWDKYCLDCRHVAADCTCEAGYSHNLTNSVNIFDNAERSVHDLPTPL